MFSKLHRANAVVCLRTVYIATQPNHREKERASNHSHTGALFRTLHSRAQLAGNSPHLRIVRLHFGTWQRQTHHYGGALSARVFVTQLRSAGRWEAMFEHALCLSHALPTPSGCVSVRPYPSVCCLYFHTYPFYAAPSPATHHSPQTGPTLGLSLSRNGSKDDESAIQQALRGCPCVGITVFTVQGAFGCTCECSVAAGLYIHSPLSCVVCEGRA